MSANLITELNTLNTEFKNAIDRVDEAATERLTDAINGVEAKLRAFEADANRPSGASVNDDAEVKSYLDFIRTGDRKSMSAGSATDGGVTVPKIIHSQIQAFLLETTTMRQIASVVSTSTGDYNFPVQTSGASAEWTGETTARNTTATPTIQNVKPPVGELTARALITNTLMEDSQYPLQSFLVGELGKAFDLASGVSYMTGTGVNQAQGLLSYPSTAVTDKVGTRPFGTFQHVATGTSAALGSLDNLMDLTMALKPAYRKVAKFTMTRATLNFYRKQKDSTGQYIWQPSVQQGVPSTLLGYPVYEDESMAEVGTAGGFAVAFGDFESGYVIVDRVAMTTLIDPYSFDPYVAIKARTRTGGAAKDTSAIKFLKMSAA